MKASLRQSVTALLALLLAAAPLHAQDRDLLAFRDSIGSVRDMLSLRRFAGTDPGDDAGARPFLERGFAGLRLYELAGLHDDLRHARAAFEDAARIEPARALAYFGAGLTWARDPELTEVAPTIVTGRAFAAALGRDARSRASRAFRRALEMDPGLTEAAVALANLAGNRRNHDELRAARATLDLAVAEGRADARTSLALAEVATAQKDFDAALRAAEGAAFAPDPPAAARYALARALLGGPDPAAGGRQYFAAAAGAAPEVADRMYGDVRAVASEKEIAAWEAADEAGRRAWLRNFWDLRAALAGVTVAERIAEHYRRLDRALADYPRQRRYGAPPSNALLLERPDLPFDDRGIILLRHGEPVDIIRSPGALRNESWAYPALESGYHLLHFVNYGSPLGAGGTAGNPLATGIDGQVGQGYAEFVLVYNLLCDPQYLADRVVYDRRMLFVTCNEFDRRSVSAEVRRDARALLGSDSHRPGFARLVPFVYDLFAFRGADGLTDLTAAIELPVSGLEPASGAGTVRGVRATFVLADTLDRRITRIDTSLVAPAARAGDAVLLATLDVPVVPGTGLAQRLVIRDAADSAAGGMQGRVFDVPDFYGDTLMMSDAVLAAPGIQGSFRRGSVSLRLVPTREYGGGAFNVFYEVYNLEAGRAYATELLVEREGGGLGRTLKRLFGGGPEVRLRFRGLARPEADGVVREVRSVETNLPPGRYRLKIAVTDVQSRTTVTRERPFGVVERREGPDGV